MKKIFYLVGFFVLAAGCKKPYEPNVHSPSTGYLVVEGLINSSGGVSTITLTRTTKLRDTVSVIYEQRAQVSIESDNNESFPLAEGVNGTYTSDTLHLNPGSKYRAKIIAGGKQYVSDYSPVRHTPEIDSISWQREHDGVQIYVNTHDAQNSSRYYRWTYTETWEFHSEYLSYLDWDIDPITGDVRGLKGRSNTDSLYKCWRTETSTNLILGSSEKLSADKIFLPVRYISPSAEELGVRYFIRITQYALSHEAYLFYEKLKKNTEQVGSIFDPQPSEEVGNVHCMSDPNESAIGWVEVSEEKQAERFISNSEVAPWVVSANCGIKIIYNDPDSMRTYTSDYLPLKGVTFRGLTIVTFSAAPSACVDCTLRGTNIKPAFWP
ncbi:MAG TPA: DUF4249 domain-containing protein [Chitinophagaceae bacterium]|nr:DUF4249 domain-containing protein [Chitinophagaceae bacterium]